MRLVFLIIKCKFNTFKSLKTKKCILFFPKRTIYNNTNVYSYIFMKIKILIIYLHIFLKI